jgi:hypothetical protein
VIEHVHGMTQRAVQIARQLLDFYKTESTQTTQSVNSTSSPQLILPTPVVPAAAPNTPKKEALPAPMGPSLLPNATMKSIENKIKRGSMNDATQNTPSPKTHPAVNPVLLQQQMESGMDAQLEMQADSQPKNHADAHNQ